jgi:hypothetical protein
LNHDALHVGQLDHRVDDGELQLREFLGHLLDGAALREAHADDRVGAALGHAAHGLLALRRVADLEVQVGLAGLLLPALGAVVGGLVERLVELAAHVVDDGGLGLGGGGQQASGGGQQRVLSWFMGSLLGGGGRSALCGRIARLARRRTVR